MPKPEVLTLNELRTAQELLERKAAHLREALHELRRTKPDGWRAEFERIQVELIEVVSAIGRLDGRIRSLVESKIITEEDDDNDV
jgi:hypothetical protein